MLKLQQYVSTPVGVFIGEKNSIHVISPERKSLFEVLHDSKNQESLSIFTKLSILI